MKTLKFRQNLVNEILEGTKTVTLRFFDDKDLQVGDSIELINWNTGQRFTEAEIVKISEKKLKDIEEKDYIGHKRYKSNKEMLESYKEYYGDKVDLDTEVKIIEFRLL